ncbi:MAG: hypothetical protein JNM84_17455 [Planctomycetes bacterium]|nr:hypothetical protein [Planctomycetota bacterium]
MTSLRPLLALPVLLALASEADAQLALRKFGGAVPGTTRFDLSGGTPGNPVFLLFSDREQQTPLVPGVTLDIDLTFLQVCSEIPLFYAQLNGSGAATRSIPIPAEPLLEGVRLTFQAFEFLPFDEVSNKTRLTFQAPGTFAPTADATQIPIITGQGFVEPDGKVLLVGGSGPVVNRYDPDTQEFSVAGVVPSGNILATQTLLADGRVFVCGGIGLTGQPTDEAWVWDPATGLSTQVGPMTAPRAGHAAARLNNGRVLIVGGARSLDFADLATFLAGILETSEIFDPVAGTLTPGPSLLEKKLFHSATTLTGGDVLIAGGLSVLPVVNIPTVSFLAQTYLANANVFGLPALMSTPRMLHGAVALSDGRALLAGGVSIDFTTFLTTGNIADLIIGTVPNAITYRGGLFGSFSSPQPLQAGRMLPAIAAIPGAKALIAGGFNVRVDVPTQTFVFEPLLSSDFFAAGTATPAGDMAAARIGAVAVTLPEGKVLVAGGGALQSELFQPR